MEPPFLLDYQTLSLPDRLDGSLIHDIPALKAILNKQLTSTIGEAILLPKKDLPVWYYFLLFKELCSRSPEIIMEARSGVYLVLRTIYKSQEVLRPESVYLFPALVREPFDSEEIEEAEIRFDMSAVPVAEATSIDAVIDFLLKKLGRAKQVVLEGQTNTLTALLCFVMWRKKAREVSYKSDSFLISL